MKLQSFFFKLHHCRKGAGQTEKIQSFRKTMIVDASPSPFQIARENFRMSQDCAFVSNYPCDLSGTVQAPLAKPVTKRLLDLLELPRSYRFTIEVFPNLDDQFSFGSCTPLRCAHNDSVRHSNRA